MEKTGYRFMNVSVKPVTDSDIVDGKFIARRRYVASVTRQGLPVIDLAGDTAPEALRNVAMWMESEGFEF